MAELANGDLLCVFRRARDGKRWQGLLSNGSPFLRTPKMKNAPALVQGLVMAWQELVLFVLTWAAIIGVGVAHRLATWEATLWCLVLLTQSLPYLASVMMSLVAAVPAPRLAVRLRPARIKVQPLAEGSGAD